MLYLHDDLKQYFANDKPLFEQIMSLKGEHYREQKGRLTQRVRLGEIYYFIKQHTGVGWREIFKNMLQGRWPVLGAKNEWLAIQKLNSLGIATAGLVGYGKRGCHPARQQSFVLMQELSETKSLEDVCREWPKCAPDFRYKQRLINEVARIARVMHENGINHRDFYLCHFLLQMNSATINIALIDLHRAKIRKKIPLRWRIKDLAGLYFSSKEIGLTRRDLWRFMRQYSQKSLREILKSENNNWNKVKNRGEQLYRDHRN